MQKNVLSLTRSVSLAVTSLQRVAQYMLNAAAAKSGLRFTLTHLMVGHLSRNFSPPRPVATMAGTTADAFRPDPSALHRHALHAYETAVQNLNENKFVPRARIPDLAAAIISDTCITASKLSNLLHISIDTASRWLNKCVAANLLRKIPVGKEIAFINICHFATLQDLPIPLSTLRNATALNRDVSRPILFPNPAKYLDSYPRKYLESHDAPF